MEEPLPSNLSFSGEVDDDVYDQKPKHPLLRHVLWQALLRADDWPRFPENRPEVWAMAANAFGVLPHGDNEISRYLASEPGQAARAAFSFSRELPAQVAGHLKRLSPEERLFFFRHELPQGYGMLLKDFGDVKGLEKMRCDELPDWAYPKGPHLAPYPNPLPRTLFHASRWTKDDLVLLKRMGIATERDGLTVDGRMAPDRSQV